MSTEIADASRVLEWMRAPNRKPAQLAFTHGPERQAAYWIEIAQAETGSRGASIESEVKPWRDLCRRLYIELIHCDKQLTNTLDDDGEPLWQQGATVRDVLADASAALSAANKAKGESE